MQLSRRDMLKIGGLGAVGAAGLTLPFRGEVSAKSISELPDSRMPPVFRNAFVRSPKLEPYKTGVDGSGRPMHYYSVTAKQGTANIVPGLPTPILGYNGIVPGPRIDVDQGTKVVLQVRNQLPATHPTFGTPLKISTHLHGSASLPQFDGYASDVTPSGQTKFYHYPNHQGARTLWYHDHGVHYTAQNAYSGLAAQYHMHDPAERDLLPQGDYDVAVTLSDIAFKANAKQLYDDRSQSGLWGDVILVNGVAWPKMKVKKRIYRFRILNASISRSFRPSLSPAPPMVMVAMDGGLAPKAVPVTNWRHGNAERYEVLIDFRKFATGAKISMNNLSNPNNRDFDNTNKIMQFEVVDDGAFADAPGSRTISSFPDLLVPSDVMKLQQTPDMKVRNLRLERSNGLWTVNGETWDDVIRSGFKRTFANVGLGDTEVWNLQNNSGGWFHPLHIHLVDFKILSRNGRPAFAYEQGPKDVAYVGENETVKVIMKFGEKSGPVNNTGKYMVHCHNLVHEDHDMMHQFSVGLSAGVEDPNDPITKAPCGNDGEDDKYADQW